MHIPEQNVLQRRATLQGLDEMGGCDALAAAGTCMKTW